MISSHVESYYELRNKGTTCDEEVIGKAQEGVDCATKERHPQIRKEPPQMVIYFKLI